MMYSNNDNADRDRDERKWARICESIPVAKLVVIVALAGEFGVQFFHVYHSLILSVGASLLASIGGHNQ